MAHERSEFFMNLISTLKLDRFIYMVLYHNTMVKSINSKELILETLLDNKEELLTIRTIAQKCNINYKSAYNAIFSLKDEGLVELKKVGNSIICSFKEKYSQWTYLAEKSRRQKILKKRGFKTLVKTLERIPYPHVTILFGSQAKGTANKHSDIDLLIITEYEEEIDRKLPQISLPLHVTYVTYEEFRTMVKSKEFTVVSEALKKNIILVGGEEYYRLLENAYW